MRPSSCRTGVPMEHRRSRASRGYRPALAGQLRTARRRNAFHPQGGHAPSKGASAEPRTQAIGTSNMLNFTGTIRVFNCLMAALLLGIALVSSRGVLAAGESGSSSLSASHHPDLDYLKAVNTVAPPQDPQLLFLLMAAYS